MLPGKLHKKKKQNKKTLCYSAVLVSNSVPSVWTVGSRGFWVGIQGGRRWHNWLHLFLAWCRHDIGFFSCVN
jgi:hypothetical protein